MERSVRQKNPSDGRHPLYPVAPAGYGDPAQINLATPTAEHQNTNVGKATSKAGAYGGSELGSLVGGALGPPIIGGIVGNLVGERVGEKVIKGTGFDKVATQTGDKLSSVIGRDNVEKVGEITLRALGYSDAEECVCCPCLTASQVLLFLTIPFYFFNIYKLGLGVYWDSGCSTAAPNSSYVYNTTDNVTDVYPCEFGFHYMVVSGSVWMCLLPFWITGLLGNCWRQCCCCCCDPLVICSTVLDFIQKCCCECGKVRICEILWFVHCTFHIVWSLMAALWLIDLETDLSMWSDKISVTGWLVPTSFAKTTIASIVLDFILAGSELFHRIRLKLRSDPEPTGEDDPDPLDKDAQLRTSLNQGQLKMEQHKTVIQKRE